MGIRCNVTQAPAGIMGFDTTDRLHTVTARQYYNQGYRFCVRYIARDDKSEYDDLNESEAQAIVDSGMALSVVQHPLAAGWSPSAQLGQIFGRSAAANAGAAGLPARMNIWLDLEGVKAGTPDTDVIDYCNAWFSEVESVGYVSGVYIGASPGLSADQLYWSIKTRHYWKGGSDAEAGVPDDIPHRGYQLVQYIHYPGTPQEFDSNVTKTDAFGGGVLWAAGPALVA
jgi:hypothetical protein